MKAIRNTPDELVLENRPWAAAVMTAMMILITAGFGVGQILAGETLEGVAILVVGGAFGGGGFVAYAQLDQLILDRAAGVITLRRTHLFGTRQETLPLHRLQRVEAQGRGYAGLGVQSGPHQRRRPQRLALVLDGDDTEPEIRPLTRTFTRGAVVHDAIAEIERWLQQPREPGKQRAKAGRGGPRGSRRTGSP